MILLLLLPLVLFLLLMGLVILVLILLLLLPPRISSFGLLLEVLRLLMVLDLLLLLQLLNLNGLLVAAGDTKLRPAAGRTILLGLLAFISLAPGVVQDATPDATELAAIGCSTGLLTFSIAGMDLGRTACSSSIRSSYSAGAAAAGRNIFLRSKLGVFAFDIFLGDCLRV
jgi:hypothetical protein